MRSRGTRPIADREAVRVRRPPALIEPAVPIRGPALREIAASLPVYNRHHARDALDGARQYHRVVSVATVLRFGDISARGRRSILDRPAHRRRPSWPDSQRRCRSSCSSRRLAQGWARRRTRARRPMVEEVASSHSSGARATAWRATSWPARRWRVPSGRRSSREGAYPGQVEAARPDLGRDEVEPAIAHAAIRAARDPH